MILAAWFPSLDKWYFKTNYEQYKKIKNKKK